MTNFVYQGQENNAVVFVNPSQITHIIAVKQSASTTRKADGYFTNRTEIANRRALPWVKPGCDDKCAVGHETETISVSFSVSPENIDDIKRRWVETKAAVDLLIATNVIAGFRPQHTLEIPVVADPVSGE